LSSHRELIRWPRTDSAERRGRVGRRKALASFPILASWPPPSNSRPADAPNRGLLLLPSLRAPVASPGKRYASWTGCRTLQRPVHAGARVSRPARRTGRRSTGSASGLRRQAPRTASTGFLVGHDAWLARRRAAGPRLFRRALACNPTCSGRCSSRALASCAKRGPRGPCDLTLCIPPARPIRLALSAARLRQRRGPNHPAPPRPISSAPCKWASGCRRSLRSCTQSGLLELSRGPDRTPPAGTDAGPARAAGGLPAHANLAQCTGSCALRAGPRRRSISRSHCRPSARSFYARARPAAPGTWPAGGGAARPGRRHPPVWRRRPALVARDHWERGCDPVPRRGAYAEGARRLRRSNRLRPGYPAGRIRVAREALLHGGSTRQRRGGAEHLPEQGHADAEPIASGPCTGLPRDQPA